MNTNDKTNSKLDPQNKDEAIAEVSATEADAVAGGTPSNLDDNMTPPIVVLPGDHLTKTAPSLTK